MHRCCLVADTDRTALPPQHRRTTTTSTTSTTTTTTTSTTEHPPQPTPSFPYHGTVTLPQSTTTHPIHPPSTQLTSKHSDKKHLITTTHLLDTPLRSPTDVPHPPTLLLHTHPPPPHLPAIADLLAHSLVQRSSPPIACVRAGAGVWCVWVCVCVPPSCLVLSCLVCERCGVHVHDGRTVGAVEGTCLLLLSGLALLCCMFCMFCSGRVE